MHLDDLNNSQIILLVILLTILLSFAITIALFAFYGSPTSQQKISQTFNRIVERTVEKEITTEAPATTIIREVISQNNGEILSKIKNNLFPIYNNKDKFIGYGVAIATNKLIIPFQTEEDLYLKYDGDKYNLSSSDEFREGYTVSGIETELSFFGEFVTKDSISLGDVIYLYTRDANSEKYFETFITEISSVDGEQMFFPFISTGQFGTNTIVVSKDEKLLGFLNQNGSIRLVLGQ